MIANPTGLGPVQLLVIAFEHGKFERRILAELRRLREHDVVRLLDLLFVVKDEDGEVAELAVNDLTAEETAQFGTLVGALIGFGTGADGGAVDGARAGVVSAASQNGSLLDPAEIWFLADAIPRGTSAAVVLLEHRWALPLRAAIEAAGGHDLVDTWVHPEDLVAIGARRGLR
jgi:uncharacterized membrane protein